MARKKRQRAHEEKITPLMITSWVSGFTFMLGMLVMKISYNTSIPSDGVMSHENAIKLEVGNKIGICVIEKVLLEKLRAVHHSLQSDYKDFAEKVLKEEYVPVNECVKKHFGLLGNWRSDVYDADQLTEQVMIGAMKGMIHSVREHETMHPDRAYFPQNVTIEKMILFFEKVFTK